MGKICNLRAIENLNEAKFCRKCGQKLDDAVAIPKLAISQ